MMKCFLFMMCACAATSMKLPPYFKPCFRDDPDLNSCFKQHAIDALPHLITEKGDPDYGIPPMLPMRIPEMHFDDQNLKFSLIDVTIIGIDSLQIVDYRVDIANRHEEADFLYPRMELFGHYKAKGSQMGMDIDGAGPFNITSINCKVRATHDYVLDVGVTGKDHMSVKNLSVIFDPEQAFLRFDGLFKDPEMNDNVNGMLNENWREMLADMGPTISKPLAIMATEIYHGITDHVPYHDIYPESAAVLAAEKD